MAGETDPTTAPALTPGLGGVDHVQGLTLLVEGRVPEEDYRHVVEAHLDVDPQALDTDIDVLLFEGGDLVLHRHLAAVLLALDLLEKQ